MHKLQTSHYSTAQPLFAEMAEFNLSVAAVLAGTAPGEVYVDDVHTPQVGFVISSEGHYLAGDSEHAARCQGLREIIPPHAYLIFHPVSWEGRLNLIWVNRAARQHSRQCLRFQSAQPPNFHHSIPEGFQLRRIDHELLTRTDLQNHEAIANWVGGWHSPDYFLQHGVGFCLVEGDTIVSWCLTDCVNANQCEIGITTDGRYRRRGLAAIVVSATVDVCLKNGLTHIGWHCLSSNSGSLAVAKKVGFAKIRDYVACSSTLPAENATDLSPAEYGEWAAHYETFAAQNIGFVFRAAGAWAMAGEPERAFFNLRKLADGGWQGQPAWLEDYWWFESLHGTAEFESILARLREQANHSN